MGRTFVFAIAFLLILSCVNTIPKHMNLEPSQRFYYSDNDFLNYEIRGSGKITLIFLHGFAASLRNWDDVIKNLPENIFTSYLVDLKGSGLSSKPRDSHYSIKDNTELIIKFIKHNNLKNYTIIGHSMGGAIALFSYLSLADDPQFKPKKLILLDPAAYKTEIPFFVQYLRIPILSAPLYYLTSPEYKSEYTLRRLVYDQKKINPEIINRYAIFMHEAGYGYALMQTAAEIIPDNIEQYVSRYRSITSPVLVIWGKEDPAIPLSSGQRLVNDLPNAKLHVIEKCGHNAHEEYPEEVAELIRSFMEYSESQ